jgi:hypothetical protein
MNMKNKLFAVAVACGLSFNLAAEAPGESSAFFGSPVTPVIEDAAPNAGEVMCTSSNPDDKSTECWASYRAVLVARFRRVQRHGTWT